MGNYVRAAPATTCSADYADCRRGPNKYYGVSIRIGYNSACYAECVPKYRLRSSIRVGNSLQTSRLCDYGIPASASAPAGLPTEVRSPSKDTSLVSPPLAAWHSLRSSPLFSLSPLLCASGCHPHQGDQTVSPWDGSPKIGLAPMPPWAPSSQSKGASLFSSDPPRMMARHAS